jgi:hypothetical protein
MPTHHRQHKILAAGRFAENPSWSVHRDRCAIEFVDPMPEAMSDTPRESCSSSHGPEFLDDPASLPWWLHARQRIFADVRSEAAQTAIDVGARRNGRDWFDVVGLLSGLLQTE